MIFLVAGSGGGVDSITLVRNSFKTADTDRYGKLPCVYPQGRGYSGKAGFNILKRVFRPCRLKEARHPLRSVGALLVAELAASKKRQTL